MNLQFNSNGKLARFYSFFQEDGESLPKDLCTYFWGLVGRAAFTLFFGGGVLGMFIYGLVKLVMFSWAHKRGVGVVVLVAVGMVLIVWLGSVKKRKKIELFSEPKAVIRGKIDSVKGRYCPRIEWRS